MLSAAVAEARAPPGGVIPLPLTLDVLDGLNMLRGGGVETFMTGRKLAYGFMSATVPIESEDLAPTPTTSKLCCPVATPQRRGRCTVYMAERKVISKSSSLPVSFRHVVLTRHGWRTLACV